MKTLKIYFLLLIAGTLMFSCKKNDTTVSTSVVVSHPISKDSLCGSIYGTMTANKTYYVTCDISVPVKDTLYIQSGVTVKVLNNSQIHIAGTIISAGTQAAPIEFTSGTGLPGSWGGFACDSAQYVSFQWTHIDATGGPDGTGSARKTLVMVVNHTFIFTDCWVSGGQDDGLRLQGPQVTILRNTFQGNGSTDGEAINIKDGCTGDIAYNYIWSQAGTGVKVETNSTIFFPQTKVNVYNNTVVNSGFRRGAGEPGRGTNFDVFAAGNIYNNIYVNVYWGLAITPLADTNNVHYGNNFFYTTVDSVRQYFYPAGSWGKPQPSDIISPATGVDDPKFVNLDLNVNNTVDLNNAHLQTGSPAIGHGNATYNKDMGCYPTDGTGNKH